MNHLQLLYVDPGSGYLLAQVVTGLAGAVVILKNMILGIFRNGDDKE